MNTKWVFSKWIVFFLSLVVLLTINTWAFGTRSLFNECYYSKPTSATNYHPPCPIKVSPETGKPNSTACTCTFSQGAFSTPLPFFSDNQSALDFYAYSNPLGSCANSGFELSDQLLILLYEDLSSGEVSFIFIADLPNDGSGGNMVVEITCLPPSASVALADDAGELAGAPPTMNGNFVWDQCCTDGGVISGLGCGYSFVFDIISMNGISTVTLLSGSPANPIYTNVPVSQCPMIFNCGGDACCESVMTLDAMIQNTSCELDSDGSIDLEVTGECLSQITYEWSNGETTQDLSDLPAGTYTVTVTESTGCTVEESFDVGVEFANPQPVIQAPALLCEGDLIDLSVLGNYDYFEWSTGEFNPSIQITQAGTYWVTVTTQAGCIGSDSLNIELQPVPTPLISGPTFLCEGEVIILEEFSGFPIYEWSTGGNNSSISVSSPGIYSLIVTNEFGCTGESFVEVVGLPTPMPVITGPATICSGGSAILKVDSIFQSFMWNTGDTSSTISINNPGIYSVTVTGAEVCPGVAMIEVMAADTIPLMILGDTIRCAGDSTLLSGSGAWSAFLWSTGDTTNQIMAVVPGTYTLEAVNETGCRDTALINTSAFPNTPVEIEGNTNLCANNATSLTVSGSFLSILWSTGELTPTISTSNPGIYTVATIDTNGCPGTDTVVINALTIDSTLLFVSSCNPLDTGIYEANYTNQYGCDSLVLITVAFELADTNLVFNTTCNPADSGIVVQNLSNQFGCDSVVITTITLLPSDTLIVKSSTCDPLLGDTSVQVLPNQYGCDSLVYTYIEVLPSSMDTLKLQSCSPADTGIVIQYFVNQYGCDSIWVQQTDLVPEDSCTLNVEVLIDEIPCPGDLGQITLKASFGFFPVIVNWWVQGNPMINMSVWSSPLTPLEMPGLMPGLYFLELNDANGNILLDTIELIEPAPLSAEIEHPFGNLGYDLICADHDDGVLAINYLSGGIPPIQYFWSNGEMTAQLQGLSAGKYLVTVSDANDCQLVLEDSIVAPPTLLVAWNISQNPCDGLPAAVSSVDPIGGLSPYTYKVDGLDVFPPNWPNVTAGNHLFRVMDALGCSKDTVINIQPESMIFVDLGPDLVVKPGTFVAIEAGLTPMGVTPSKIVWEPNYCVSCLKHGFVAKENTAISVTVYSAEGCVSTDNILVEVEENKVYIPNSFSPDSDGINDIFAPLGDPLIVVEDFSIFDRWGELVYRNGGFNLGSPEIGWDGVFKDKAAAVEVYVYVITLRWPDGTHQLVKGDVLLLR